MDAQGRTGALALSSDAFTVLFEQFDDPGCGVECLVCRVGDTGKKEVEPSLPGAVFANLPKQPVLVSAMGLQVEAQVEERFPQHAVDAEVERHQQATDTTIAVEEGMDCLELDVQRPALISAGSRDPPSCMKRSTASRHASNSVGGGGFDKPAQPLIGFGINHVRR